LYRIDKTLSQEDSLKSFSHDLEAILLQPELKKLRVLIDIELQKNAAKMGNFGLSDQINYAVQSYGKRLRPIMTLLSTGSVGGEIRQAVDLALALELMHTATLVHDDVLDNDEKRRGLSTVHRKWSVGEAVLAGDALLSLALSSITDYGRDVLNVFSETGMRLAEGEYLDFIAFNGVSEEQYLRRVEGKSASLFKAAAQCGALIGKGSELEVSSLANFGNNFGMAYQIRDDILDLANVDSNDLKQHRITLPIIHLLRVLDKDCRNDVLATLEVLADSEKSNKAAYVTIIDLLNEKESIRYCQTKVNFYANCAIKSIQPVISSNFKTRLIEITESLLFQ
jgi:geranylgeranyl pyrophosphate synthase